MKIYFNVHLMYPYHISVAIIDCIVVLGGLTKNLYQGFFKIMPVYDVFISCIIRCSKHFYWL